MSERNTVGVTPCDPLQATGALGYAARLADGLWRKHYQQDAPNWQLCPDLLGILTQIDNMTTGLMKKPTSGVEAAPAPSEREQIVAYIEAATRWEHCDCGCPGRRAPASATDVRLIRLAAEIRMGKPTAGVGGTDGR